MLAKQGYGGGNPEELFRLKVDTIMNLYNYEIFLNEYQTTEMIINEED